MREEKRYALKEILVLPVNVKVGEIEVGYNGKSKQTGECLGYKLGWLLKEKGNSKIFQIYRGDKISSQANSSKGKHKGINFIDNEQKLTDVMPKFHPYIFDLVDFDKNYLTDSDMKVVEDERNIIDA